MKAASALGLAGAVLIFALPITGRAQSEERSQVEPTDAVTSDHIVVKLDLASILHVPAGASTLVIGNPSIADATVQRNGVLVITGKNYGTTNIMVLDDNGAVVHQALVEVEAPRRNALVVYRGVDRETWSCAPRCERTLTLGDRQEFFDAANSQSGTRNSLAKGQASAPAGAP